MQAEQQIKFAYLCVIERGHTAAHHTQLSICSSLAFIDNLFTSTNYITPRIVSYYRFLRKLIPKTTQRQLRKHMTTRSVQEI